MGQIVERLDGGLSGRGLGKTEMERFLDCASSEIARRPQEIVANTKAYVGPLAPGIFGKVLPLDHIYTSFPEGKISILPVEIGGKTVEELEWELEQAGVRVSRGAKELMRSRGFAPLRRDQTVNAVRLRVGDLGCESKYPFTDEVFKRARELGLREFPAGAGPELALELARQTDQPLGTCFYVGMKPMRSDSHPSVLTIERYVDGVTLEDTPPSIFTIERYGDGVTLDASPVPAERDWNGQSKFVFDLPERRDWRHGMVFSLSSSSN